MVTVTKIFKFEASHNLPYYDGACSKLHGHSYKLEVTVSGEISNVYEHNVGCSTYIKNPKAGMIIDFKDLKDIVNKCVVDKYDHEYLNEFFFNPTAELMVQSMAKDIKENLPKGVSLVSCRLWETDTSYAEYKEGV